MEDGEVELSDDVTQPNPHSSCNLQDSIYADSIFDDFLKNARTCTHTHTCNPPGPDAAHTHTCYHTHTQVIASEEDEQRKNKRQTISKPGRPSGNREAVRKYREKKKAHAAYLEEEVKKLRLSNQQLLRKLQGQAILKAEVLRLRSLLLNLKGKIDDELGVPSFQMQCSLGRATMLREGSCGVQTTEAAMGLKSQTGIPCFHHQELGLPIKNSIGGAGQKTASCGGGELVV